jgi:3-deoxy-7-phosphoheptulonate synthase
MLVNLHPDADVTFAKEALTELGLWVRPLTNQDGNICSLQVDASSRSVDLDDIERVPGVAQVLRPRPLHPLIDACADLPVKVGPVRIGAATPVLIAGPCSVDSEASIHEIAAIAARAGAGILRGGAYKPRTSPYSFAGHGAPALGWLRDAANAHGLGVVTEVLSEKDTDRVAAVADMLQVGSRNMQNFALLRAVGSAHKPVMLKRGRAATVEEWLLAGEHLMAAGAPSVVFCERGVRGFDGQTRNMLDLGAVALMRHAYRLPIIVDPSHATGRRDLIRPMVNAAIAAGADAIMVEVNPAPGQALSDGPQALDIKGLDAIANDLGLRETEQS